MIEEPLAACLGCYTNHWLAGLKMGRYVEFNTLSRRFTYISVVEFTLGHIPKNETPLTARRVNCVKCSGDGEPVTRTAYKLVLVDY